MGDCTELRLKLEVTGTFTKTEGLMAGLAMVFLIKSTFTKRAPENLRIDFFLSALRGAHQLCSGIVPTTEQSLLRWGRHCYDYDL